MAAVAAAVTSALLPTGRAQIGICERTTPGLTVDELRDIALERAPPKAIWKELDANRALHHTMVSDDATFIQASFTQFPDGPEVIFHHHGIVLPMAGLTKFVWGSDKPLVRDHDQRSLWSVTPIGASLLRPDGHCYWLSLQALAAHVLVAWAFYLALRSLTKRRSRQFRLPLVLGFVIVVAAAACWPRGLPPHLHSNPLVRSDIPTLGTRPEAAFTTFHEPTLMLYDWPLSC